MPYFFSLLVKTQFDGESESDLEELGDRLEDLWSKKSDFYRKCQIGISTWDQARFLSLSTSKYCYYYPPMNCPHCNSSHHPVGRTTELGYPVFPVSGANGRLTNGWNPV